MRTKLLGVAALCIFATLCGAQVSRQGDDTALLQDAARSIEAGKLTDAESALQSVLRSRPGEYRGLDLLGVVRILQRREAEAGRLFRRAIQTNADFAPAHAHLGLLYVQSGQSEDAVPELREALRLDPARSDAAAALVQILRDQAQSATRAGDSKKALAMLSEARQNAPENPDVHFEFGMTALQELLLPEAVDAFRQTLKFRENDALAHYNLGRAFIGQSQFEQARQQFARYVELQPDDYAGHCALGMMLAALEHPDEARKQFERSIILGPAQTESYFRLGLLDLDASDLESATKNFRQVLDREPKHAAALAAIGRVAFEQKRYAEALDLLQSAISDDSSLREAHYYLGLTFARLGRKQESSEQLEVAMKMQHDEVEHRRIGFPIQDPTVGLNQESPLN